MKNLTNQEAYQSFINGSEASLIYISTPECNVCKVLKPKIIEFIESEFPKIKLGYVDSESVPEVAAQNRIFTVPTILVFLEGKEFIRKSRNINLTQFYDELERPYSMFFED